ncbi:hypothetical protein D9M68_383200 [compost metagenome]|uniref:hypothetical protein n=1 Tax=Cupriavidus necator TaxID=106590 RepID=UPI0028B5FAD7
MAEYKRLDEAPSMFADHVLDAADRGRFPSVGVGVLIADLERTARVARGLTTLFSIIENNDLFGSDSKPLRPSAIEALAVLGAEAAEMLVDGIERTAEWAEKSVMEGEQ